MRTRLIVRSLALLATIACGRAVADGDCGSQRFATLAVGDALGQVRAARIFAEAPARRTALARLEAALVELLQSEPDSVVRGGAWLMADDTTARVVAVEELSRIDAAVTKVADNRTAERWREDEMTNAYRQRLGEVVKLVDPRSPKACAAVRWQVVYTAALDAEAR